MSFRDRIRQIKLGGEPILIDRSDPGGDGPSGGTPEPSVTPRGPVDEVAATSRERRRPEGNRPDRPSKVGRSLDGVNDAFDLKGGGGSPTVVRSDVGVLLTYDLEAALQGETEVEGVIQLEGATGAANTVVTDEYTPDELPIPRQDLVLKAASMKVATSGNFDWARLRVRNPEFATQYTTIGWCTSADVVARTGIQDAVDVKWVPGVFPFYLTQGSEIQLQVRSNAGGATTVQAPLYISQTPRGVRVPR